MIVTNFELLAYADEALAIDRSTIIELWLRESEAARRRLALLLRRRDQEGDSLGEIWRRQALSCPDRELWESFQAGNLGSGLTDYLRFHTEIVACRNCQANLRDLRESRVSEESAQRQRRFFETSAGHL